MIPLQNNTYKVVVAFILIIIFSLLYGYIELSGLSKFFTDTNSLQSVISQFGYFGPLAIIFFMAGAVVMSPIPSAPIALTSGIFYGHTYGTIYVLIGAEIGAIVAFMLARLLGYETVRQRFGDQINLNWLNNTRHLMLIVGISRLIPFISFDIVSYAAGLTKLSVFQFAIATLIGILPASFVLAHIGSEMVTDDINQMMFTILLLGLITLSTVVVSFKFNIKRRSK